MKLPLLSLVDSLVNVIANPYKSLFATNIGRSFTTVYQKDLRSHPCWNFASLGRDSFRLLISTHWTFWWNPSIRNGQSLLRCHQPSARKTNVKTMTRKKFPKFHQPRKEDWFPRNLLFLFLFRLKLPLYRPMACSVQFRQPSQVAETFQTRVRQQYQRIG